MLTVFFIILRTLDSALNTLGLLFFLGKERQDNGRQQSICERSVG